MELISVIVPVYGAEPYLDRCIRSIADQTYPNLEIILVDDGSPDRSGEICDAWASKDSRIRVIHQSNAGGGAARNTALDMARGTYIGMADSDDYLEPHMYEHLLSLMTEDVDIAECEMLETESDDAPLEPPADARVLICAAGEAMAHHIRDRIFRQTPPNKLYRRSTVGEIRFPVGNRIDDEFFTYRVIANCRKLAHSDRRMYAYRQQPGSVMHKSFALSRLQTVDAKCQRLELLQQRFPELVPLAKTNLLFTCLYQGQMALLHLEQADRKTAMARVQAALALWPLNRADVKTLPAKHRLWAVMSRVSLPLTCRLRNRLKIGM